MYNKIECFFSFSINRWNHINNLILLGFLQFITLTAEHCGLSMRLKYWFGFINISPMWSGMEERKGKRWDGLRNLYSLMDKLIIRSQLFSDFFVEVTIDLISIIFEFNVAKSMCSLWNATHLTCRKNTLHVNIQSIKMRVL